MSPPHPSGLRIEIRESIGHHAEQWDALVASMRLPTPFLASWWIDHVDDHVRHVVLVFDGDQLAGGLACSLRRRAGVTVVGFPGAAMAPDHQDIVARPGFETDVVEAIRTWLAGQRPVLIRTDGTPTESLLQQAVPGWAASVRHTTAPYVPLDTGEPVPRSSRLRNTVRRTRKRLAKQGLAHRRAGQDPGELERALDELIRLHRIRWPQGSNFERRLPEMLPAIREGARQGTVGVHELVVDDRVVASMLVMDVGERRSFYQSGRETDRSSRGAGTVLMDEVVQDAQAAGMVEFDMLRGAEPYKLDWTDQQRDLVVLLGATGAVPRVAMPVEMAYLRAKPGLRRVRDRVRDLVGKIRNRSATP